MKIRDFFKKFKVKNKANVSEWTQLANFLGLDSRISKDERSESTYFACLKILSESVGKLPLKLMQKTPKQGVIDAKKHPLYNVLRNRPNKYMTSTIFKSTIEQIRNHEGDAFVLIDGGGSKTQLFPLDSKKMTLYYDDKKLLSDVADIIYIYEHGGKKNYYSSEEILHFKTSQSFNGITSLSVREILKTTIQDNQKAQKLQGDMYDNGFVAKAVIQYTGDLSDDNAKNFMANIANYAQGKVQEGKGFIPIPLGTTYTPLNQSLGDNEFLELKKFSALQIASAFGIKPVQINDYSKSSYSSSESQNLAFLIDTLLFILNQYEEELNYKLLSTEEISQGYFFKFNINALLRADQKTQIESLSRGVQSFIYTPNEARDMLDLEHKPGGDNLIGNGSTITAEQIGAQWGKNTSTGGNKPLGINACEGGDESEQNKQKLL